MCSSICSPGMSTCVFSKKRHMHIHPYEPRWVAGKSTQIIHDIQKNMQAYKHAYTALQPREWMPQSTLHIISSHQTHLRFSLSNRKGAAGRETIWLSNSVINAHQEHFWWDLKVLGEVGPSQSNCTSWTQEQRRQRDAVTQRLFPSVFLGNNEQNLQSDYSVTPAGPAFTSVLDRRCSSLSSD